MVYFLSLTGGVDEPMVCNQSSFPFSLFFVSLLISFFLDLFICLFLSFFLLLVISLLLCFFISLFLYFLLFPRSIS